MSPVHPSENRCLFAVSSELVLRITAGGLAVLAILLMWFEFGRAGLATIAAGAIVIAANRFNQVGRHRLSFILASSALLALGFLLHQRLGWGGGVQWPLLALAMVCLLNRRWNRSFALGLSSLLVLSAAVLIHLPTKTCPEIMTALQTMVWLVLMVIAAALFARSARRAEDLAARVRRVTRTDILTGLHDRDAMKETLGYEVARSNRSQQAFSIILTKVDDFSGICERHGDRCGDWVLVTVANLLRRVLREQDHSSRWANEEYLLILPDTDSQGGGIAAERIRIEIDRSAYLFDGEKIDFTLTFAVVVFDGTQGMARCLEDLYEAVNSTNAPGFVVVSNTDEATG